MRLYKLQIVFWLYGENRKELTRKQKNLFKKKIEEEEVLTHPNIQFKQKKKKSNVVHVKRFTHYADMTFIHEKILLEFF